MAANVIQSLISPPPSSSRLPPSQSSVALVETNQQASFVPCKTLRRSALVLLLAAPAVTPSAAGAFSIGIPGPKEWLREQKKKSAQFLLAPIDASRRSLQSAYSSLTTGAQNVDSEELQRLLNSAARDCVPRQRSSLVDLQSRTGVEVCTFRLIVKNAASLLDDKDPVKLEAEAILGDLIRSFSSLITVLQDNSQLTTDREKVKSGLMDTISALDRFELGVKNCLGS